jgi:hypothetical protein
MIPKKIDAIRNLVGGAVSGATDGSNVIYHDEQTPPTEVAIQEKLKELEAEYEKQSYARARQGEYPSIQELVVALYDEEDKALIIEKRNAVKEKYPKPK